MRIVVQGWPPTLSKTWGFNHARKLRFKSEEYRTWILSMKCAAAVTGSVGPGPLYVETRFVGNWLTKRGTLRKMDCDNRLKALNDALAAKIGRDDSEFVDSRVLKVHHPRSTFCVIEIKNCEISFWEEKK